MKLFEEQHTNSSKQERMQDDQEKLSQKPRTPTFRKARQSNEKVGL